MHVLITGATGFIGGHLARRLLAEDHRVTALVRSPERAGALAEMGAELLHGDLSIFADPERELAPADVVIHLAGVVSARDPAQYEAINYTAAVDLMRCLARQTWRPRRMLFASSLAAAGPSPADRPWTEADPTSPIDPYGEAKARAERALAEAPFPVTSFRPPIVIGPGDPATLTLYQAAARGVGMRVAGAPQRLSWIDVSDLVDAIVTMAHDERDESATYYATSPQVIDTARLWSALSAALDRRVWVAPVPGPLLSLLSTLATGVTAITGWKNQLDAKQVAQMRAPAFVCSGAALERDLGWTAQVEFEEAIAKAAAGYREMGWL